MPRKCDQCGSYKLKATGASLHIFKQKDGSYSKERTNNSISELVTIRWKCKTCGFIAYDKLKPWKLINGEYVV